MRLPRLLAAFALAACARQTIAPAASPATTARSAIAPATPEPPPPPERWRGLIGEYDTPAGMRLVLEDGGRLFFADTVRHAVALAESGDTFTLDPAEAARVIGVSAGGLRFERDPSGRATQAIAGDTRFARREIEPRPGTNQLQVTPVRPVAELRAEALAASPPKEPSPARAHDLVELNTLDPSIKLEIRYATTNNFLGTRFYDEARAFMQRPAAEAVARANRALAPLGFGLLIHDAYRPWYVTKMFWDATPLDKRWLVANPAHGSLHNRGAAVDLTLYELATGQPVEMPSTYDESTDRAFADYPGGTSRQRWCRSLLRRAMEAQGFVVNPNEWWHFDFKDWRQYAIGNIAFDRIAPK